MTAISPTNGPTAGGMLVTITGSNFKAGATVTIGGKAATHVAVTSTTSLSARTVAATSGVADVVVAVGAQEGRLVGGFTYSDLAVTKISPTFGVTTGGTAITITGVEFAADAEVRIGGVLATNVQVLSPTAISARTGAGGAEGRGPVEVKVGTVSATLTNGFTYYRPLVLTTYYGGGEVDWSLFSGARVPNGGAAPDPLGQKGTVWALNQMGQWGGPGGWTPGNLVLASPRSVPFESYHSWSTDVMITGTPPKECAPSASGIPSVRFMLDTHFGGTGERSGSMTIGVLLDFHDWGGAVVGGWSSTTLRQTGGFPGPQVVFGRWYNIRQDVRVVSPTRIDFEYFLNGVSFGVLTPPDWWATDALAYASPWRNIVFWGCDNKAYLTNMQAAR